VAVETGEAVAVTATLVTAMGSAAVTLAVTTKDDVVAGGVFCDSTRTDVVAADGKAAVLERAKRATVDATADGEDAGTSLAWILAVLSEPGRARCA